MLGSFAAAGLIDASGLGLGKMAGWEIELERNFPNGLILDCHTATRTNPATTKLPRILKLEAFFLGPGGVNAEISSLEIFFIEHFNGFVHLFLRRHGNETKTF